MPTNNHRDIVVIKALHPTLIALLRHSKYREPHNTQHHRWSNIPKRSNCACHFLYYHSGFYAVDHAWLYSTHMMQSILKLVSIHLLKWMDWMCIQIELQLTRIQCKHKQCKQICFNAHYFHSMSKAGLVGWALAHPIICGS